MTTILEKTAGLVAFVRTVDAGSFQAASRLIGSSPSAVSKSVAKLERRLGAKLIQRSTRQLGLTSEGIAYYERVAPLLRALDDAGDIVQNTGTARGLLRVTAPVELGRGLIASWAQLFLTEQPEVKLELNVTDRHADLIRENYDVAVRIGALTDSGLTARGIASLPTLLVAAPAYLQRRGTPPRSRICGLTISSATSGPAGRSRSLSPMVPKSCPTAASTPMTVAPSATPHSPAPASLTSCNLP